ncbi:unnamed protein product [Symbiodinium sp. CCMP2592]|nr:unnamed protein product [Symbiodinium sp. CCMP2592]
MLLMIVMAGNYWFELHSQQTTYATPEGRELSSEWFSWNEDGCCRLAAGVLETQRVKGFHIKWGCNQYATYGRSTLLVYTESSFVEQTTPAAFQVTDQNSTAEDLGFPDLDLDYDELGGTLSWSDPVMTSEIEQYLVYLAGDEVGNDRSLYANFSFGATNLSVPAETNRSGYIYWLVYTTSSLIEQTTPAELLIFDVNGTVDAPFFVGQDLNLDNLEGSLQWTPQASSAQTQNIQDYIIYLATSSSGDTRSQVGAAVPVGTNLQSFSNSLVRGSQTHFLVYARSSLAEQSTPAFIKFADAAALFQARDLFFSDGDLDEGEIAGNLSWVPPDVIGDVTFFRIYFSTTGTTQSGDTTALLEEVDVSLSDKVIAADTSLQSYAFLAMTSNSPSTEQRTPSTWLIYDEVASVANVSFVDLDLDESQLGGTIEWDPPLRTAAVSAYLAYLAQDGTGAFKSQIEEGVPHVDGATVLDMPTDTPVGSNTDIVVYTRSTLVEQTTPASLSFSDTVASVSGLAFPDLDLDGGEVGGTLDWSPPTEMTYVSAFNVYFAVDALGTNRSQLGSLDVAGTSYDANTSNMFDVLANSDFTDFSHCVVYTSSTLAEQSTPAFLAVQDYDGSVSNIQFSDKDLDLSEVGGDVHWQPPSLLDGRLASYSIYLSSTTLGQTKQNTIKGSLRFVMKPRIEILQEVVLAADTARSDFDYVLVSAASALEESRSIGVSAFLL